MKENLTDLTIKTYDAIAAQYEDRTFHLAPTMERVKFLRLLPRNSKVLDAGCGYGREVRYFLDCDIKAYGIDASREMLDRAKGRALEARLQLADIRERLPFEDNFFDGVWCRGVLHHLERAVVPNSLEELRRILKPEGILLVMTREGQGKTVICEELTAGKPRLITFFEEEELTKMVAARGFEIIESYHYNEKERYDDGREDANFVVVLAKAISPTSQ